MTEDWGEAEEAEGEKKKKKRRKGDGERTGRRDEGKDMKVLMKESMNGSNREGGMLGVRRRENRGR